VPQNETQVGTIVLLRQEDYASHRVVYSQNYKAIAKTDDDLLNL
jgi:hypothetical protein